MDVRDGVWVQRLAAASFSSLTLFDDDAELTMMNLSIFKKTDIYLDFLLDSNFINNKKNFSVLIRLFMLTIEVDFE